MFERHRFCLNPDCMKSFNPICPSADCCKDKCRMRLNYLRRLAKKILGKNTDSKLLWCYIVTKCLFDKRKLRPKVELLKSMGMDFSAFDKPLAFVEGDTKSMYVMGELGLGLMDKETAFIIKRNKA